MTPTLVQYSRKDKKTSPGDGGPVKGLGVASVLSKVPRQFVQKVAGTHKPLIGSKV